jgi:hypothetical protein
MPRAAIAAILVAVSMSACSNAWDDYDPRLGGSGGGAQSGSGAGTPTSSADTSTSSSTTSSSTGEGGGGDGGGPTAAGGSTSESSSSGTPTETLEIVAVQADCTDTEDPDADACDEAAAEAAFTIDADAMGFNLEWIGYLRFEPGDELAGKTVESVRLRLVVASEERSDSDDSGEIWLSAPFDREDLNDGAPAFVGDAPVGASVGAVALGQEVTFNLVDTPIYFAVDTNSIDGVDYLDERSATPPTLVVTYH